jgi:hypothetical protein
MKKFDPKFNLLGFFIITTLVALIARIIWILYIPNEPISDFAVYQNIAVGLANGNVLPEFGYQGMGYPAFLSVFYWIFNSSNIIIAKWLNVILSILTLIFIFFTLKKFLKNSYLIGITYLVIAFLPNHIAYTSVLGTEVLTNFLFSMIIFIQISTLSIKYKYPLLGFVIGLATLTKPYFLAYPLLLMVIEWLNKKDWKQTILIGLVTFIVLQVTISPWTIYNYQRYGKIVSVSSNGGVVLYLNNNDDNKWGHYINPNDVTKTPEFERKLNATDPKTPAQDEVFKEEAINWIKNNPTKFIRLGKLRVNNTFLTTSWDIPQYTMNGIDLNNISAKNLRAYTIVYTVLNQFLHYMTLIGFVYVLYKGLEIFLSLFSLKKRLDYYDLIPALNIAMFVAIPFVFEGQPRYNFPVLFLLIISMVSFFSLIYRFIIRFTNQEKR